MSFRFRLQKEDDPCYYDSRSLTDLWKGDRDERSGSECKFWKWWWSLSMVTSNFVLVLDDSRILGSLCGLLSHGCLIYGQFHGAQSNFWLFSNKILHTMKLNRQKAETMGCLKLLRSCASGPFVLPRNPENLPLIISGILGRKF